MDPVQQQNHLWHEAKRGAFQDTVGDLTRHGPHLAANDHLLLQRHSDHFLQSLLGEETFAAFAQAEASGERPGAEVRDALLHILLRDATISHHQSGGRSYASGEKQERFFSLDQTCKMTSLASELEQACQQKLKGAAYTPLKRSYNPFIDADQFFEHSFPENSTQLSMQIRRGLTRFYLGETVLSRISQALQQVPEEELKDALETLLPDYPLLSARAGMMAEDIRDYPSLLDAMESRLLPLEDIEELATNPQPLPATGNMSSIFANYTLLTGDILPETPQQYVPTLQHICDEMGENVPLKPGIVVVADGCCNSGRLSQEKLASLTAPGM